MADRIDHAAEAVRGGQRAEQQETTLDAIAHLISANAHATMALVEQQRIANLIALDITHEQYTVPADAECGMDSYVSTRLRADIREGLGL